MTTEKGFAEMANEVFDRAVADYHKEDSIDAEAPHPYAEGSVEGMLYAKNWVDAAQWHMEDIIRDPELAATEAIKLKRRIDASNQLRTDMVEGIDDYFMGLYGDVTPLPDATINTETPAWAIDRLSILALKLWHMAEQADRKDADGELREKCRVRLATLLQQRRDLSGAIDRLLEDIAAGRKEMRLYRQMKLYNDADTNPALYGRRK